MRYLFLAIHDLTQRFEFEFNPPPLWDLEKFSKKKIVAIQDFTLGFEFEFYPHPPPSGLRHFFKKTFFFGNSGFDCRI